MPRLEILRHPKHRDLLFTTRTITHEAHGTFLERSPINALDGDPTPGVWLIAISDEGVSCVSYAPALQRKVDLETPFHPIEMSDPPKNIAAREGTGACNIFIDTQSPLVSLETGTPIHDRSGDPTRATLEALKYESFRRGNQLAFERFIHEAFNGTYLGLQPFDPGDKDWRGLEKQVDPDQPGFAPALNATLYCCRPTLADTSMIRSTMFWRMVQTITQCDDQPADAYERGRLSDDNRNPKSYELGGMPMIDEDDIAPGVLSGSLS